MIPPAGQATETTLDTTMPARRAVSHGEPRQRLCVTLPLPPSVNQLYPTVRGRRRLSLVGQAYKHDAGWLIKEAAMKLPWRTRPGQRYQLEIVLYFPDMRSDISNRIKAVEDTTAAALGFNDRAVDMLIVRRGPTDKIYPRCVLSIEVLDAAVALGQAEEER